MGREVRRVPKDWEHPKDDKGYIPLFKGEDYAQRDEEFWKQLEDWENCRGDEDMLAFMESGGSFLAWVGEAPNQKDYMPNWPVEQRTHWQMYETTTEGTPISPPLMNPDALAQWLADNGASAFGSLTATYGQWLEMFYQSQLNCTE
jgi:hypothetical protein